MNTVRTKTAWLLVVLMLLALAMPAMAEEDAPRALPAEGESLEGFVVREVGEFALLGAPTVLLEHEKTGALVYYIAANDVNRSFDITFRTPAMNDHGTPHVFEHITISGSDKYPSPNLFFPMVNQTYSTYINAMTMWNSTTYPLASLSEEQLVKLMDVYLDGVFHPLLYKDERLFRREAWRYELADADDDITITGTVYNEMQGARTIDRVATLNVNGLLYPGSIQGNESGGDPAVIPELTYEELLDFHQAYYHPSNALVVLYGDLDLANFLRILNDDYFSHYERVEIEVPNGDMPAQDGFVQAEIPFPVEEGTPVESGGVINYAFVANGADMETEMALNLLTSVLSHQSSPLQVAVRERMPGASVSAGVDMQFPQMTIQFSAKGVNQGDSESFKALVDETMAQIVQEGFDPELVQAVIASTRFSLLTMPEMSNLGTSISPSVAMMWARNGNIEYFNDFLASLEALQQKGDDVSLYTELIQSYILDNGHAALAMTYPQPGLAEENAAQLAQELADLKASLSEEEVQAMVDATAEMAAFSAEEAPVDLIQSLQAVTVQTLPEEMDTYAIEDTEVDGVRYVTAATQAGDIGFTQVLLDTSWVPQEGLHTLMLYSSLLGSLDTQSHTKEELSLLNTRYLNNLTMAAGMMEEGADTYRPILSAQWIGLMDDYESGIALVNEILFETKFDDIEDIQNQVAIAKTSIRQTAAMMPYVYQMLRASAAFTDQGAYESYLSGLDYYDALKEIEQKLVDSPDEVVAALEAMQTALKNKEGAIAVFTGNEASVETFKGEIGAFFAELDDTVREAADYSALPRPAKHEALVVDSQVQYNMVFAPMETLGIAYSGMIDPLAQIVYDGYLTPKLRHGLGAYDSLTMMNRNGMMIMSYRDPTIAETYEVLSGMGAFVEEVSLTQEDLDRYIISAYSGYAMPMGALNGASYAIDQHLSGRPADEKLTRMQEMKAMTVEDVRTHAPALTKLFEEGMHATAGGAAIVDANKDLFDEVIRVD